jgi:peptide/nickel transport system permease protein
MREYIARRLLLLVPMMIGVSFLTFAAFHIIPADPVDIICTWQCSEDDREEMRHQLGLDRPWYEQYGDWLAGIPQGDFGKSLLTDVPVSTELMRRLPVTFEIMLLTMLFTLLLGPPAGVVSAIRPGTAWDVALRFLGVFWLSVPSFYIAVLAISFGLLWFGWTPPQFGTGPVGFFDAPLTNLEQFALPCLILALGPAAVLMRLTRSAMLEVLRNDYIRTAWAKGLRERAVIWRHAIRNALIPVFTVSGLQVAELLGGAVIIESIFALNGIGKYTLESVLTRDLFVVQSMALFFAVVYVAVNLAVDIGYAWLDPRIRVS